MAWWFIWTETPFPCKANLDGPIHAFCWGCGGNRYTTYLVSSEIKIYSSYNKKQATKMNTGSTVYVIKVSSSCPGVATKTSETTMFRGSGISDTTHTWLHFPVGYIILPQLFTTFDSGSWPYCIPLCKHLFLRHPSVITIVQHFASEPLPPPMHICAPSRSSPVPFTGKASGHLMPLAKMIYGPCPEGY